MTFQTIPLDKLTLAEGNVRRTAAEANLDELTASIAAHGLLQNLSVRPLADGDGAPTGRYEVVAGGRRYRALKRLAKAKAIKKTQPVPCAVIGGFSDTEIGLAENLYCPMHPADQYEAWAPLAAEGQGPADIAARFGVSEQVVQQRLRLGKVSPKLLDLYRGGAMKLDTLMAFTLSEDHTEQERVWAELPEWNRHPDMVRRYLTKVHVALSEPLARLVGVEAYEAAGGRVLRDLFDERRTWLLDRDILDRLATDRLETTAAAVRAEGWRWVEVGFDYPPAPGRRRRLHPVTREPTVEEADERAQLETRLEQLYAIAEGRDDEALAAEAGEIERRLAELDDGREAFTPEQTAIAGAIVWLGPDGIVAIDRGLVRPEDEPQCEASDPDAAIAVDETDDGEASPPETDGHSSETSAGGTVAEPEAEPKPKPLSERLIEDLSAHRTAGLRLALTGDPETALLAVVHALAVRLVYGCGWNPGSCLDIQPREPLLEPSSDTIRGSAAVVAFEAARKRWRTVLPGEAATFWDWLVAADTTTRLGLLAFCAGASLDATVKRNGHPGRAALAHADRLAVAVNLDMRRCWSPTKECFLGKVSKRHILAAVAEAAGPDKAAGLDGLKKEALIELAEPILTEAQWLPDLLRSPVAETDDGAVEAADGASNEAVEVPVAGEPYRAAAE